MLSEVEDAIRFFQLKCHWLGAEDSLAALRRVKAHAQEYHKLRLVQSINMELTSSSLYLLKNGAGEKALSFSEFRATIDYFLHTRNDNTVF